MSETATAPGVMEELETLRRRVGDLETRLSELEGRSEARTDWRAIVAEFSGDEGLRRVFDEAGKIREEDRRTTKPS
jgi:hypothetical protein